jgi:hypothetical protein
MLRLTYHCCTPAAAAASRHTTNNRMCAAGCLRAGLSTVHPEPSLCDILN